MRTASIGARNRYRKLRRTLWLMLLVPSLALAAAKSTHKERTVETTPNPRVTLSNMAGHIVVSGWDRSQIRISSDSSPEVEIDIEQLPPAGRAEKIHLITHELAPHLSSQDENADYALDVPVGCDLEIHNPDGSVRIEKIHGDASVESVGGAVAISDVSGHLWVRSFAGDIEVIRSGGRVEANSVNGSLRFVSPAGAQLRASTTAGKIFYEGDFLPGGDYRFSDYSGDVEILTPSSASFELNAKTVRGKVVADPEVAVVPNRRAISPFQRGYSLFGRHNTGAATVELRSFSGTIRIRRLN